MPKEPRPLFHVAGARDAQVAFADQKAAIGQAVRVNGVDGQDDSRAAPAARCTGQAPRLP